MIKRNPRRRAWLVLPCPILAGQPFRAKVFSWLAIRPIGACSFGGRTRMDTPVLYSTGTNVPYYQQAFSFAAGHASARALFENTSDGH